MARVKRGVTAHARHKKVLDMATGYRGRAKSSFTIARPWAKRWRGCMWR